MFPLGFSKRAQQIIDLSKEVNEKKPDAPSIPRYGKITDIVVVPDGSRKLIFAKIRFDDQLSNTTQESQPRPFVLTHYVEELALVYGDNLVGLRVRVDYVGNREDQGYATIVNAQGEGDLEAANTLRGFQTIIAPAG